MTDISEVRDYLTKMAAAADVAEAGAWADRAGLDASIVESFLAGEDIALSDYLKLCTAAAAIALPIPAARLDEAVMLIEAEGIYAEGTSPSPFDRYRDI